MEKFEPKKNLPPHKGEEILQEIFSINPVLANLYQNRNNAELTLNEEGLIICEGHMYANSERMRSLVELGNAIRESLPPVPRGFVRLWRGNREGEVGMNPSCTNSLEGIALPFLKGYKGVLSFVDIPEEEANKYLVIDGAAKGSEFIIPAELAKKATIVGVSPEEGEEVKSKSRGEAPSHQGSGWDTL